MPYLSIAMRSTPKPNAKPWTFRGSYPTALNTFGCTIPQPMISSHPFRPHVEQPFPRQAAQAMSTSADGSVNGKKCGRNRVFVFGPKSCFRHTSTTPLRSANEVRSSTRSPST